MKFLSLSLLFIVTALSLSSCSTSSSQTSCQESDWYEIGRRQGASGAAVDLNIEASRLCSDSNINTVHALYENGYQSGLLEFCQTENAYELGRSGRKYFYVCPAEIELSFIDSYRRGQRVFALENNNRSIDSQLKELYGELSENSEYVSSEPSVSEKEPTPEKSSPEWISKIRKKILNLRQNRAQNQKELSKITPPTS